VTDRLGRWYRATPDSLWRRQRRSPDFVTTARLVRERLRSDPAVPLWARFLLPVVAFLQLGAIYVVRPPYLAGQLLRRSRTRRAIRARVGRKHRVSNGAPGPTSGNVDASLVAGFGEEWTIFD